MSLSLLPDAKRQKIVRRVSWTALLFTTVVSTGCATKDATPRVRVDTPTPTPIATATPVPTATPTGATPTPTGATPTPTATPRPATPTPSPTATPVPNTACTPIASLPAQTMNPAGGSLTLPPCAGYTGQIDYPSFTGNAGTISAALVSSTQNVVWENDGAPVPLTNSGAFFYIGFELSSTNPNDTAIQFGSNLAGAPASCGQIDGSFTNGTIYYAEGEFAASGSLPRQLVQNSAGTNTYQAAGCALANQPVSVGGPNAIILSTSEQFFDQP